MNPYNPFADPEALIEDGLKVKDVVPTPPSKRSEDNNEGKGGGDTVPADFSIEDVVNQNCYRITGVRHNCKTRAVATFAYDLSKSPLEVATQDVHVARAKAAKPTEFRACPAPVVYAVAKALWLHRDDDKWKVVVETARQTLNGIIGPGKPWVNTLSRVKWSPNGPDEMIHNYGLPDQYSLSKDLVGPDGYIKEAETKADAYVAALFDTDDTVEMVNQVFKWITDKDSHAWRFKQHPAKIEERVVALGVGNLGGGGFSLCANGDVVVGIRPALGVRPVGAQNLQSK